MKHIKLEHRGISGTLHGFNQGMKSDEESLNNRAEYLHLEICYHIPQKFVFYEISYQKEGGHAYTAYRDNFSTLDECLKALRDFSIKLGRNPAHTFTFEITQEQIDHFNDYYKLKGL